MKGRMRFTLRAEQYAYCTRLKLSQLLKQANPVLCYSLRAMVQLCSSSEPCRAMSGAACGLQAA